MTNRAIISTDKAPAAIGPYSQAVKVGSTVYLSGQIPLDPATMELVARGESLAALCERLCRLVEAHDPSVVCSVLAVDEGGHLRPIAAPSLPDAYSRAIDGLPIGPKVGSCGTAAHLGREVLVEDIATDPLWEGFAHLARAAGVPLGRVHVGGRGVALSAPGGDCVRGLTILLAFGS